MISVIITLILIGLLLYVVDTVIPMDATIRKVIRVVVLVAVILWLLQVFGIWNGSLPHVSQATISETKLG